MTATTPHRLGLSYSRFSSPEQAAGDSEDRQRRDFEDFCRRHDLTPLPRLFCDRGKSGYHDEHRKKGYLGQLLALAKDGRFEAGTVLVIEAWDRLGRLRCDEMVGLVSELCKTGLAIGVCRLNDIFTEADFGSHKWTSLAVFIQLAHQESKQKADRVAASWTRRRADVSEGKDGATLRATLPAWVEKDAAGRLVLIKDRAAAVRRVFALAGQGLGIKRIIRALDAEGVPAFGSTAVRPGRTRSRYSGRWTPSYVALLLRDRRVLGELQPRTASGPAGPPLAGYYPAAVSQAEFDRAKLARSPGIGQDRRGRAVVHRQSKNVNAFQGLLKDARSGQGWTLHVRRSKGKVYRELVPAAGVVGRDRWRSFPYDVFEEAVLSQLAELAPADVLPKKGADRLEALRARLTAAQVDVKELKAELGRGFSRAVADVLRDREREAEEAARVLDEARARASVPAEATWRKLPSLVALVKKGGDDARLRVRAALRQLVDSVWVLVVVRGSWRLCAVQVHFAGGATRDYLLSYRPAVRLRGGSWAVRSFAEAGVKGTLDLTRPDHVKRLEAFLSAAALPG
jgi:DNA invertase Pin-like site-specific DNA recombinase